MKDKGLQAELYEIQIILYWILGVLLFNSGHHILGWISAGYGISCVPPTVWKMYKAKKTNLPLKRRRENMKKYKWIYIKNSKGYGAWVLTEVPKKKEKV